MRSRALPATALQGLLCVLMLCGCHSVFGLDDYELVTEGSGAAGGLGRGGSGAAATGGGASGGGGGSAAGGTGGQLVAVDDCCVDDAGPPDGWEYAVVSREPGDSETPTCQGSNAQPLVLLEDEPGGAVCGTECGCGNPEGGSCTQNLTCYLNSDCTGESVAVGKADPNCQGILFGIIPRTSCDFSNTVTPATCPATAVDAELPTWQYKHFACPDEAGAAVEGDCDAGQHCLGGPQGAQMCIWKAGVQQCPAAGGFVEKLVVVDERTTTDTRTCAGCVCSDAATTCVGGSYRHGGLFSCATTVTTTGCTPTGDISQAGIETDATPQPQGACMSSGVPSPQGSVVPGDDVTLCCRNAFED